MIVKLSPFLAILSIASEKGRFFMKNFFKKYGHVFAALALVLTTITANSTCAFFIHQEKLPEGAKTLRRF